MKKFLNIFGATETYLRMEYGSVTMETGQLDKSVAVSEEYETVTVSDGKSEIKIDFSYPHTLTELNGSLLYRFGEHNVILYYR